MATRMVEDLPEVRLTEDRTRKISERSETTSENESHLSVQPVRRRPTRSLTEVRPDAYIFDDGLHFEVRPVEEKDENSDSGDGGLVMRPQRRVNICERQRSSESKLSVTESSERGEESDVSSDALMQLNLDAMRHVRPAYLRQDSTARRSSDGGDSDKQGSFFFSQLKYLIVIFIIFLGPPRRQLSQTHSEPDSSEPSYHLPERAVTVERSVTFGEPKITVIPPSGNPRSMLMAMHTEYTSITDELETVCGLLSPPRTPRLLSPPRPGQMQGQHQPRRRHCSEMSNPEIALFIEKEHLKDAEENDYLLMENLIQRRYEEEEDEEFTFMDQNPTLLSVVQETREFRNSGRSLRRSSAIEGQYIKI